MAWSTDGKNWVAGTTLAFNWSSVAWSPQLGLFVIAGGQTPYLAYSTDGKNWTGATTAGSGTFWSQVTWSPQLGIFVVLGSTSGNFAAYSLDGKNWTNATVPATSSSWFGGAWSTQLGLFVAVGDGGISYTANVFPSQTGSLLLPPGNVVFSQPGSSNVTQFNPITLAQSNIVIGSDGYNGLVLAPNGNVITVPTTRNVVSISTTSSSASNIGPVTGGGTTVSSWFQGGVLLPSGNVMFTPGFSANVGLFDPVALTFSNSTQVGSATTIKFSGSTLLPSGQVVMVPSAAANVGLLDSMTPAPPEFCLSPYVNKF